MLTENKRALGVLCRDCAVCQVYHSMGENVKHFGQSGLTDLRPGAAKDLTVNQTHSGIISAGIFQQDGPLARK